MQYCPALAFVTPLETGTFNFFCQVCMCVPTLVRVGEGNLFFLLIYLIVFEAWSLGGIRTHHSPGLPASLLSGSLPHLLELQACFQASLAFTWALGIRALVLMPAYKRMLC